MMPKVLVLILKSFSERFQTVSYSVSQKEM